MCARRGGRAKEKGGGGGRRPPKRFVGLEVCEYPCEVRTLFSFFIESQSFLPCLGAVRLPSEFTDG